jgi:heat shock protein HslJ
VWDSHSRDIGLWTNGAQTTDWVEYTGGLGRCHLSMEGRTKKRLALSVLPRLALLATVVLVACSTYGTEDEFVDLVGSSWQLLELQSSDDSIGIVRPDDPAKYEMMLAANGTATLRLDCNRGTGRWMSTATNRTQGTMTFAPLAMTRAACPPGSLDTRVARELGFVRTYLTDGDTLRLIMMADGGSQVWSRLEK